MFRNNLLQVYGKSLERVTLLTQLYTEFNHKFFEVLSENTDAAATIRPRPSETPSGHFQL